MKGGIKGIEYKVEESYDEEEEVEQKKEEQEYGGQCQYMMGYKYITNINTVVEETTRRTFIRQNFQYLSEKF